MARLIACAVVCGLVVGCGDDGGSSVKCGEGTHEIEGICVVNGRATSSTADSGGAGGTSTNGGSGGSTNGGSGGSTSDGSGGSTSDGSGGSTSDGSGGSTSDGSGGSTSGGSGGSTSDGSGGSTNGGSGGASTNGGSAGEGDTGGSGGTGGSGNPAISTEPFECGSRDVTGATVVQGAITVDTTWSGVVHVAGDVSVRNEATLTIEPGTKVIVGLDYEIDFGWEDSSPTLLAEGTPDAPILFCGETERAGYWKSLSLQQNVNPSSVLRNVLVADAGSQSVDASAALVLRTPALIQGVQIVGSQTVAIETGGFAEGSEALRVKDSDIVGLITDDRGIDLPDNSDLTGNVNDVILLFFGEIATSVTFENHGVAYEQVETYIDVFTPIGEEVIVTFEAGVTYGIPQESMLNFGDAVVHAMGTSESKVTFTNPNDGYCSVLGQCEGGEVVFGSDEPSVFEHTVFQRLAGVSMDGNVEFDEVEILDSVDQPLTLSYYGKFTPDSRGLSIDSGSPAIRVYGFCDGVGSLPADTLLPASATIEMDCAEFETDTEFDVIDGARYVFPGNVFIDAGVHVTLNAGVQAVFQNTRYLGVRPDGSLSVEGTASDPVELTGTSWPGIRAESADVSIDHAVIDGAGQGTWNGVEAAIITELPISVTNTTISNSWGWGLAHSASDSTNYATTNTFVDNVEGDITSF